MSHPFLNDALEQMARTIFPLVSELEVCGVARTVAPAKSPSPDENRRSLLPSMFDATRVFSPEIDAKFSALLLTDEQIGQLTARIAEALAAGAEPEIDRYSNEAFGLELAAINHVLRSYGQGQPVNAPHIDGPVIAPPDRLFEDDTAVALEMVAQSLDGNESALSEPFRTALALLDVNDFVGHFALEPTEQGINRAALERVPTIEWSSYRYSAIIVPGFGPFDHVRSISPRSRLQVQLAAKYFRRGLAPFIVLSGGRVWPAHTRHRESESMRQAIIERFRVDDAALIVEPYARHTPANLRNATRRLIALGIPLDKETLVVTNDDQLDHMMSEVFPARCLAELGRLPGGFVERVSATAAAFLPSQDALWRNPMDPLDP